MANHIGACGYLLARLFGVVAVVQTHADDLLRVGDRRAKRGVGERDAPAASGRPRARELLQPVVVE